MAVESRKGLVVNHPLGIAVLDQSEQAHLSMTTTAIVGMACDVEEHWNRIVPMVKEAARPVATEDDVDLLLSGYEPGERTTMGWNGETVDVVDLRVNTAAATGSPIFTLMAHLDAYYAQHAYVEPDDVAWLAEVIRRGRWTGVLRPARGWEDIVALCEQVIAEGSDQPLVTSDSFSDPIPSERWDEVVTQLRRRADRLRIWPGEIDAVRRVRANAFALNVYCDELRHRELMG